MLWPVIKKSWETIGEKSNQLEVHAAIRFVFNISQKFRDHKIGLITITMGILWNWGNICSCTNHGNNNFQDNTMRNRKGTEAEGIYSSLYYKDGDKPVRDHQPEHMSKELYFFSIEMQLIRPLIRLP